MAGFVTLAKLRHGAGVADDDDGMEIFRCWRRWGEGEIGEGNLRLILAAARAEMGGGGEVRQIVVAARAGPVGLIGQLIRQGDVW